MDTIWIVLLLVMVILGAPLFTIFGAAAMLLFQALPDTSITGTANDVFSEKFADSPLLVFDWPGDQGSTPRGYRRAQRVARESGRAPLYAQVTWPRGATAGAAAPVGGGRCGGWDRGVRDG